MQANEAVKGEAISRLPRIELVSLYMNRYLELDLESRLAFEAEFERRGLPIPDLSRVAVPTAPSPRAKPGSAGKPLAPDTFLSYILLIYTLSGLVYSWIFLARKLLRKEPSEDPKHEAIQTGISMGYVALEALVLMLVGAE